MYASVDEVYGTNFGSITASKRRSRTNASQQDQSYAVNNGPPSRASLTTQMNESRIDNMDFPKSSSSNSMPGFNADSDFADGFATVSHTNNMNQEFSMAANFQHDEKRKHLPRNIQSVPFEGPIVRSTPYPMEHESKEFKKEKLRTFDNQTISGAKTTDTIGTAGTTEMKDLKETTESLLRKIDLILERIEKIQSSQETSEKKVSELAKRMDMIKLGPGALDLNSQNGDSAGTFANAFLIAFSGIFIIFLLDFIVRAMKDI